MAVHDPESSLQEKQQALKIGRQKKIQIIDGQRVEVMTGKMLKIISKIIGSFKEITINFESACIVIYECDFFILLHSI